MDLDELIELLGIEVPEDANTDEAKLALIKAKLKEMTGGGDPPAEEMPEEPEIEAANEPAPVVADDDEPKPGNVGKGGARTVQATVKFSRDPAFPLMVRTVGEGRQAKLDGLVSQGKISAAVAKTIAASFCTEKSVSIELSNGGSGKEFDLAVKIATESAASRPLAASGREYVDDFDGDGAITLAHSKESKSSPRALAEKAAKERAGK